IINVYNDLGLTESLQYFLPRYWIKKQYNYIKTSIFLSLGVQMFTGLIIAGILWFGAPWLATNYFQSPSAVVILRYFCLYFLGINVFDILVSIFYAFQNTLAQKSIEFIRMISVVGFTLFFFFSGRTSIERYSLNWILGLAIGIIAGLIIFFVKYKKSLFQGKVVFEKNMLKEYIKYAFWCFLGLNALHLFGQIIQQLVILILGPEAAGFYTNFLSLYGISAVIIGPIIGLVFPMVSELITKKDTKKLQTLFNFFYTYFSVFAFFLTIFSMALGPEIALVLFGKKFILSGKMMALGALFTIANIFVGFNFSVLAGLGKIKERVKILFITALITVVLSIIGMYSLGIYGAVLTLGIGETILFILSFKLIYKDIKFGVDWRFIIKNLFLGLLLGIILRMIKSKIFINDDLMRLSNLWKLILIGLGFFVVFGLFNFQKALVLKGEIKKLRN
ncbi:MAG TPA: oligosaccharide flippase family protein, partial [Candidatus Absconditabacterales bacterium]|nr:oligosaccharide flippase family protein [Candidatus Absconditabacterales bacterium]